MRRGSKQHEEELKKAILELQNEGYRVIDLNGVSPDAIAIKDGKIVAIEVLGKCWRKCANKFAKEKGLTGYWHGSWTHRGKSKLYSMFDEVKIFTFKRNGEGFTKDSEMTDLVLKTISESKNDLRTSEIWEQVSERISQRRVRQILAELREKKLVTSEAHSEGRHGRYNTWHRDT